MKTIALRFGEHFSPPCGTIAAHQEILDALGYVWYGKLGSAISSKAENAILAQDDPKILLINSGKTDRYWAHISVVTQKQPLVGEYPHYYQDKADQVKTWFKVKSFEKAPSGIMAQCTVASSGSLLTEASKRSMSPYFIIQYNGEGDA